MKTATIVVGALLHAAPLTAQVSDYAGQPPREIAALSEEQVDQLLAGAGMGYALAAELNGLPGPRHVLELADSLHLTPTQRERVAEVFAIMQNDARRLGASIVERERELDRLFAERAADPAGVRRRTVELGELYGELRAAHLNAHLATTELLHEPQIARYGALRGYHGASPSGHGAHH